LFAARTRDTIARMYQLAKHVCEIGRRAYARQLVAATEGNFSQRLDQRRGTPLLWILRD